MVSVRQCPLPNLLFLCKYTCMIDHHISSYNDILFRQRDRNMSVASVEATGLSRSSSSAFKAPEHEGWLHKQGDKYKTWNKRWFVLKGSNLFYFKSPKVNQDLVFYQRVTKALLCRMSECEALFIYEDIVSWWMNQSMQANTVSKLNMIENAPFTFTRIPRNH